MMDQSGINVCIVVLAGGRSQRMRGQDKRQLVHPRSQTPLVQYVCREAARTELPVYCLSDAVLSNVTDCAMELDHELYRGPYHALVAFSSRHAHDFSHCVVLAADMPDITPAHVQSLIAAAEIQPNVAGQTFVVAGRRQYLSAVYRLDALLRFPNLTSFKDFFGQSGLQFGDVTSMPAGPFTNINTPEDWDQWTKKHTKLL